MTTVWITYPQAEIVQSLISFYAVSGTMRDVMTMG
jgi:hypothetical protein